MQTYRRGHVVIIEDGAGARYGGVFVPAILVGTLFPIIASALFDPSEDRLR
jgi:hypothetical protein